ncbi:uncharacterized protein LOC136028441 [Artemia franciscana]|uniref:uncharacterized protein LOC136028441 n=1 Tax=Artemia franciscana TaxID=6661 RepID=UPI0032DA1362
MTVDNGPSKTQVTMPLFADDTTLVCVAPTEQLLMTTINAAMSKIAVDLAMFNCCSYVCFNTASGEKLATKTLFIREMWVCNNLGLDCEYEHTPMDRLHSKEVSKTSIVFRVITIKPTQWPKSSLDELVFTTIIVGKLVIVRRSRKSEGFGKTVDLQPFVQQSNFPRILAGMQKCQRRESNSGVLGYFQGSGTS